MLGKTFLRNWQYIADNYILIGKHSLCSFDIFINDLLEAHEWNWWLFQIAQII